MAFAKLGNNQRVWELLNMINPINHGKNAEGIERYKVEPYVLAADVYARAPHSGRGGWTWYTGSAGWMYQLITESFLGLQQEGNKLRIIPCVPAEWQSFTIHYRYMKTIYHIVVTQKENTGDKILTLDGIEEQSGVFTLLDDGKDHTIGLSLGKSKSI
jgi:cyclic beta-1,2-glucan synthetase